MIDWINQLCREWGDARHYIDHGTSNPSSIWGRIREGWSIAAAEHSARPDPPEVMLFGALLVSRAIRTAIDAKAMTEKQFRVLYLHYVERAPAKVKYAAAKLSCKRYYEILHRCHRVIRFHLPEEARRGEDSHGDNAQLEKVRAA